MRGFDCQIGGGSELESTGDFLRVVALQVRDVSVALEGRQRDVAEDFFAAAFRQQVFGEREPMIVAGDQSDEHDGFGAVVEEAMQSFEGAFTVVGEQVIGEFEV